MTNLPPPPEEASAGDCPEATTSRGHPSPLLSAFDPAIVARVEELYASLGPAETARATGLPYDLVRAVANAAGLDIERHRRAVEEAGNLLERRRRERDVRRLEHESTLELVVERAAEALISAMEQGKSGAAEKLARTLKTASDELRAFREEQADMARQTDGPSEAQPSDEIEAKVIEIREALAKRRKAAGE